MCSTVTKTLPLVVQGKPSLQMPANQNICGLTTIDFTDSVYEPIVYDSLSTATYQWVVLPNSGWSFIGGTNATDKNPKIEFLQYGTYTVRLTVTNDCGTITYQTLFNINQGPILQTLADTNLCFESSISFTTLATSGLPPFSYSWGSASQGITHNGNTITFQNLIADTAIYAYVIDQNGCSDTEYVFINVSPEVLVSLGQDLQSCYNDTVQLNALVSNANSPVSYNWIPATGLSNANIQNPIAFPSTSNRAYTVEVTDASGCQGIDSINLNVFPLVTIDAGPNATFCVNSGSQTLSGYTPFGGSWSGPGIIGGQNVFDPSLAGQGTHVINYSFTDSNGCEYLDSLVMTVISIPIAQFLAVPSTGCTPMTVSFQDSSSVGVTHRWYADGVLFSTQANPTRTFLNSSNNLDQSVDIKLVITAGTGCEDSVSQSIVVNPKPLAVFSLPSNSCAPASITASNNSIFKAPATYLWSASSSTVLISNPSQASPNFSFSDNQSGSDSTFSINLIVTSVDGCSDTLTQNITIFSRPFASFSLPVADCAPVSITPVDASTGSGLNYNWTISPSVLGLDLNTPSPIFNIPASFSDSVVYRVFLSVTDSRGCIDTSSIRYTAYPRPLANFNPSISNGCGPLSLSFNNTSSSGQSGMNRSTMSFNWSFGNGVSSSNTSPTIVFTNSGVVDSVYSVTLIATNAFGCSDTATGAVTVHPNPKAELTFNGFVNCAPFLLDSNAVKANVYPVANSSYQWMVFDLNNNFLVNFNGSNAMNYTILNDGDSVIVRLIVSNSFGCNPDTSEQLFYTIENPAPGFSLSSDSGCHPLTIQVTDTSSAGVTHSWYLDGQLISTQQNPQFSLVNPSNTQDTNYVLKLVITAGASGCKDSTERSIVVHPQPDASFLMIGATCPGDTLDLINQSLVKGVGSYRWQSSSAFVSFSDTTASSPQLYIPDLQTGTDSVYTVNMRVTSTDGCVDDTILNLIVYSRPIARFLLPADSCSPVILTPLDSSYSADGSALSYSWNIDPTANASGLSTANPQFELPLTTSDSARYRIQLMVTDGRGCVDSLFQFYTVFAKPNASFAVLRSDSCGPFNARFVNQSQTGQSGQDTSSLQYLWNFGDGQISAQDNPEHIYLAAQTRDTNYVIELITTNFFGCTDTVQGSITVYPNPIAQMNPVINLDCAPFIIDSNVVMAIDYINANDSYLWEVFDMGGQTLATYSGVSGMAYTIVHDGDSVIVRLITTNVHNCLPDTVSQLFYTIENPVPGFVLSPDTGCHPLFVQVTDTSTTGVSREWYLNGTLISTIQNPLLNLNNISHLQDSVYNLKLVITAGLSGCRDSAEQMIVVQPKPEASFQLAVFATCAPDTLILTNISKAKSPSKYLWTTNSSLVSLDNDSLAAPSIFIPDWQTGRDTNVDITLQLTSIDGCIDDTTVSITVYSRPIAAFSLPESDCAPRFIYPLDSSITAGNSLSYNWRIFPSATAGAVNTALPNFDIPASFSDSVVYTIYLTVTDDRGCSDSTQGTFTAYPRPNAAFNVSPMDSCGPLSIQFTNASSSGQPGMPVSTMQFSWDFGNGDSSQALFPIATFLAIPERDTTYQIELIARNAFGCEDTAFRNVTIYPNPIAFFQASTTLECSPFVIDSSIVSVTRFPIANDNYIWEIFDLISGVVIQNSNGINNLNYTILQADDSVGIRLITQNVHACRPDTQITVFKTLPDPVADFSFSSYAECHPASFQAYDSSTVGVSHQWFVNGLLWSTASSPLFNLGNTSLISDSLYLIELVVTAGTGCTDTLRDSLIVYALPFVNFSSTEVCETFTTTFTDLSSSIDSILFWSWDFGDGDSAFIPNTVHQYDSFGVYYVQLQVTDSRGCSQQFGDTVIVRPNPINAFALDHACYPDSICLGSLVDLNDSTFLDPLGTPIVQWLWDIDADGSIEYSIPFAQHAFNSIGPIEVALYTQTAFGCVDTLKRVFNVVDIPQAGFVLDSNSGCGPLQVQFTNQSTGYITAYQWRFFAKDSLGNAIVMQIDSSANPNPVPPFVQSFIQDTTYFIELTVSNCCGSDIFSDSIIVFSSPVAFFLAAPDSGCTPLPVTFMLDGQVKGQPDYLTFDWGDGNAIDTLNQQWLILPNGDTLWYWGQQFHTFIYNGRQADTTFFVTLTAYNDCGDSSYTYPIVVRPNTVQAFFQAQPSAGCEDLTVNFTDFSFGGNNITWCFEYDGLNGNCGPFTAGGSTATHTYTQGGNYTVAQIVDDGCSVDTAFQQIVVYEAPEALFQFQHSGCASDTVLFINLSTIDTGSINYIRWYFGDGDSSAATQPNHIYSSGGRYSVCLRIRSNYGCFDEYCDSVIVFDEPNVQFSAGDLCLNEQPVLFNNTSQPGFGNFNSTYWDFGDGNTSTQLQPQHTYSQAGTYRVWLFHSNDAGCSDSTFRDVLIDPIPEALFTAQLIGGDSCFVPQNYLFTNSSQGAQGYLWDFDYVQNPGVWTSTLNQPTFTFNSTGIYTVALFAFNSLNCTDTLLMNIEVKPIPGIYIVADQETGCSPLTVQFRDSLVYTWPIPIPIQSYTWYFGDGQQSNLQFPVHTYADPGIYSVKLVLTTTDGCTDSLEVTNLIEVFETPHPFFESVPLVGSQFVFNNLSSRVYPSSLYNWSFGDGQFSTQPNPVHEYNVDLYDQNYQFQVCLSIINANGCDSTWCDSLEIIGYRLNVPSAFTPDLSYSDYGDAIHFLPKGFGLRSYELEIFDGWGNRIFRTTSLDAEGIPLEAWNGRRNNEGELLPMGAYVWSIKAVFENGLHWRGKNYNNGRIATYGTVTLIR